jgi:cobyrinic acid a,c-diamide synthase
MHDLHTINQLNAEAHAASIETACAAGKYVVAEYTGLHLMTTQVFDDEAAATKAMNAPLEHGDTRRLYSHRYHPAKAAKPVAA